jgi:5'-3' exonuclease
MNKYTDLLNKIDNKNRQYGEHILLIDSMNTFIRNFSTLKSLNPGGHHVGGLLGFLRSLGFLVRTFDPTRVICVFDGKGGSMNRKNVDPNYKANREHVKVTNWGLFENIKEERESMTAQIERLFDYLECLPVYVSVHDKVEADDIISFLAQKFASKGHRSTIVSSDQDFYQIIDKQTSIYAPIKKKVIDHTNVVEIIKVLPSNYGIVKALVGDNSDNLPGVKGVGIKTIVKEFPKLVTEENVDLQYIYDISEQQIEGKKIFSRIIYDWDKVERNYGLMNIRTPRLSEGEIETILYNLQAQKPMLREGSFLKYMDIDRIENITNNTDGWLSLFSYLNSGK